jgi:ribonuclease P protein component
VRECQPKQAERLSTEGEQRAGQSSRLRAKQLTNKLSFNGVLSSNTKSEDELFSVFFVKNKTNFCRLGVSLPKKIIAKATKRNRIKRMIKNSFNVFFQEIKGIDVVVRAKKEPQPNTGDKILQSLDQHWKTIMSQRNKKNKTNGKS